jgi:hypothetical protein
MGQVAQLDRKKRARTMSWLSMGEDGGGVVGPMLAGFLRARGLWHNPPRADSLPAR